MAIRAGIVNRGDSFRKRRSRSNSLAQEDDSGKECTPPITHNNDHHHHNHRNHHQRSQYHVQTPAQNGCDDIASHTVSLLGSRGVGKTALISQFMTSEYINAYEKQRGLYVVVWNEHARYLVLWRDFHGDVSSSSSLLSDRFFS